MAINATPVGFAHPPIRPKSPGLLVKSHSFTVKFALFITGSLTTAIPKNIFLSVFLLVKVCYICVLQDVTKLVTKSLRSTKESIKNQKLRRIKESGIKN